MAGLLGMANEYDRRGRLRFKEPRKTNRDSGIDYENLGETLATCSASILFFLGAHGERLYEFLSFLTT